MNEQPILAKDLYMESKASELSSTKVLEVFLQSHIWVRKPKDSKDSQKELAKDSSAWL